jgi:diguanylate cyclase (GGDEF)-like protein
VTLLDPSTIILMSTLMGGAMSIVLFAADRSFPAEIRGLGHWAVGLLLLIAAAVLFNLRGVLPPALALLGANCMLLWGLGLSMIGTERFYHRPPSWRAFHLVWGLGMSAIACWLLVWPDFQARVAVFSFLVFGFYARQVQLIWRYGERHFPTRFFGGLMLFQALVVLLRGCLALFGSATSVDLMRGGPFSSFYLATANFMALLLAVGFMTVATRRLQSILELRSTLDPLTCVLNRRGFADIYAKERAQLRRAARGMTLLSIDLDFFKQINDQYGHAMGDRVLVHVATTVGKTLRESDHMARFGGEEFVVLLPDTGVERAIGAAERIRVALRGPHPEGMPAYTVSIGVACQQSAAEDLDGLLMRADAALYRAKANGRDRIEVAEPAGLPASMLHAIRA